MWKVDSFFKESMRHNTGLSALVFSICIYIADVPTCKRLSRGKR